MQNAGLIFNSSIFIFYVLEAEAEAFNLGCYIIWAIVAGIGCAVDYLKSHNLKYLVNQVLMWFMIVVKSFVLLSLWIFVIPVLIGLLFELLVIVPLHVPVNESLMFLLYQDWALGLIFLKIWTRLVMLSQMAPLVDPYTIIDE